MGAYFLIYLAATAAKPQANCPVIEGQYVQGFETSYLVPLDGKYRGQKIWIEDANKLAKHFSADRKFVWRRAQVKLQGCVKVGRFGALGAYNLSIGSFNVIDFAAK